MTLLGEKQTIKKYNFHGIELSTRAINVLREESDGRYTGFSYKKIKSLNELCETEMDDLLKRTNCGIKTLVEIERALNEIGRGLKGKYRYCPECGHKILILKKDCK